MGTIKEVYNKRGLWRRAEGRTVREAGPYNGGKNKHPRGDIEQPQFVRTAQKRPLVGKY